MKKDPNAPGTLDAMIRTLGARVQMANFISLRLFAGMYRYSTKEQYAEAVTALMDAYRTELKDLVRLEVNMAQTQQPPGTENATLHKFRLAQFELIDKVAKETEQRLLQLHVQEEMPPQQ